MTTVRDVLTIAEQLTPVEQLEVIQALSRALQQRYLATATLAGMPDLFERRDSVTELRAAHARELEQLSAKIGRLTTHVNFLKTKLPD